MEKGKNFHPARRILQSTSTSQKSSLQPSSSTLTADEQVKQLKPSDELLYYRKKMLNFNSDHREMVEIVERCKLFCDLNYQLEQELQRRNAEISQLQEAVSDLQIYLYQEREQVLRLYAENDKLKIREVEDRKKIDLLLSLCGTSENELTYFMCDPDYTFVVPQKFPPQLKKYKSKQNENKREVAEAKLKDISCLLDAEIISLQAQSLAAQLEEQTSLFEDHMQSLLKDRELRRREGEVQRERLQQHVSSLSSRLKESQEKLCDTVNELLVFKEEHHRRELAWSAEKARMLQNLENCEEQLGEVYPSGIGYTVSGSGTIGNNLRGKSSTMLRDDIDSIKEQLTQRESMVCMYQEQCIALEKEVIRLKNQMESSKSIFKERTQKIAGQVTYLKNKYNELDRRRQLQAEGFRNDIKMLRNRLRDVERCMYKVSLAVTPSQTTMTSEKGLMSARETISKTRLLDQELKHIKIQVLDIESDLRL